ncbi:peptidase M38 [Enemella evansiae]|uniref:metal-dependent hydrolase family protein n=1 Tax=Enemella evansiae TaxID=2016499 RepID=UPI000B978982|nr:amidohydrolase family protein [Enemella evansiae]OYO18478.1 peptidase M38 [Enemella evansiae]
MSELVLSGGRVFDPGTGDWHTHDLRIRDGRVVEVGESLGGDERLDVSDRFVLPGLIDCHVHIMASSADLASLPDTPPSYVALGAAEIMGGMLDRGFTTVRDVGGADFGYHRAQREGLVRGPRIFFGGRALSQTGGHGDVRPAGRNGYDPSQCCAGLGRVADGVDEVRRAARDELRKGADHLKIMASGGVASPTDRIDSVQYSLAEMRAAVEEAEAANRYVAAHAYTSRAIRRALEAGVRSIEHANLIDEETVAMLREKDAFVTMNLVTYWALADEGQRFGLPADQLAKVAAVLDGGVRALKLAHAGGVNPAFGTDLLGGMHRHQAREFAIRAEHIPAVDVIRGATSVAARLLRREDELGTLAEGAYADVVVVDGDPVADISVLAESRLRHVLQGGRVVAGEQAGRS